MHLIHALMFLSAMSCATGYRPGKTTTVSVDVGRTSRSMRVHLPPQYDSGTPAPLVMMFHGGFGNARQMERAAGMDDVAKREGFVVAWMDGTGIIPTWNAGACCGASQRKNVDDVGFVDAALELLQRDLSIDPHRVYAAGMSNGAMFSHRLACERADRFAAVAAVAGTLNFEPCTPSRPIAVLVLHGSKDAHVPWDGGVGCGAARTAFASVPSTVDGWARRNACTGPTTVTRQDGILTCESRGPCAEGSDVVLCRMEGMGHHWPGGRGTPAWLEATCPKDGPSTKDVHANLEAWAFFKQHTRP